MFFEYKHELAIELNGRKVSEVMAWLRHALWLVFADGAEVFRQEVVDDKLTVEVRTDFPNSARLALVARSLYPIAHATTRRFV